MIIWGENILSRTIKGSKPINCGYEYWSKRLGNKGGGRGIGRLTKKETLSRERMRQKIELKNELNAIPL